MFTFHQIRAIREHRYGGHDENRSRDRGRSRKPGSLHQLLSSLASGLASIGNRNREPKAHPARPAH